MKKLTMTLLSLALLFLTICNGQTATAATTPNEDGCYWETVIQDVPLLQAATTASTTKTITETKTSYYKNSNGVVLWYVAITATFSYNGSTSKCTSCSQKAAAPGASWSIKSSSSSRSGNSATANAIATYKNGILTRDYTRSVTIKCSKDGIIS